MSTQPMMHTFDTKKAPGTSLSLGIVLGIILLAVLLGVGTGYGITTFKAEGTATNKGTNSTSAKETPKTAGVKDTQAFPDKAEGTLKEGGFEGEGSFHLERPGGESQNVYLTSTTVDLSTFLDKKVRVWGQTFESEEAGWFMDIGYIEMQ